MPSVGDGDRIVSVTVAKPEPVSVVVTEDAPSTTVTITGSGSGIRHPVSGRVGAILNPVSEREAERATPPTSQQQASRRHTTARLR